jgi:hypothetical protein
MAVQPFSARFHPSLACPVRWPRHLGSPNELPAVEFSAAILPRSCRKGDLGAHPCEQPHSRAHCCFHLNQSPFLGGGSRRITGRGLHLRHRTPPGAKWPAAQADSPPPTRTLFLQGVAMMRLSFIGWTPQPRAGKSKLPAILYRWLLVCNPLQPSRGQVCQVSAPELFSAHHAGAHAASDPSLCVSQSLGVSQFGRALCAAHRLSGRRDEYDAFQYDELPVKHCILVSHRRQRWRKYVV